MSADFTFRPMSRDDFVMVADWLAQPHVRRWWNHEFSADAIERDFGPSIDGVDPTDVDIAVQSGYPVGLVQSYRFADHPDYMAEMSAVRDVPDDSLGIDYLIGPPDLVGKGVGREMIRAYTDLLWKRHPGATCVIVPVNSANVASWRVLLHAGFRLVDQVELEPDNPADGRLHEILRIDRPASCESAR